MEPEETTISTISLSTIDHENFHQASHLMPPALEENQSAFTSEASSEEDVSVGASSEEDVSVAAAIQVRNEGDTLLELQYY